MATRTPAKPKSQRAKSPAEVEAEKKRLAEARSAAARAVAARSAREDEADTDEETDGDAERDEETEEGRDGDGDEDGDAGSDDERDGDDDASDDEGRDGDDDEGDDEGGERAAPKPGKRKAVTPAEVRKAAEAAVRADRVRGAKIRELAQQFGFPNLGERHANGETSVRAFKDLVLERLAERQKKRGNTTFATASAAGVGEEYRAAIPAARDFEKGAAEARALLGKK